MRRKSKYSAEEKLLILNEVLRNGIHKVITKYKISQKTIRRWSLLYKYQGMPGLQTSHHNQSYSKEFKNSLVEQYQQTDEALDLFAIKHGLRSQRQLEQWIIRYNESNLKAYTPRKRDSKMSGRKTDFEERLTIIEELIKHDVNYNWAVEKYHISYQQVYGWYQKYRKSGNDPESLRDRRGKAKPEEKWTEVDRLKAENRLLRAQLEKQEMEIAFAKKINRNTQSGGGKGLRYQAIKELNQENGWSISQLCKIADSSRDGYYKWLNRKPSQYHNEQAELLEAIVELEEHNWTLGYLAMTTQLSFENRLSFTAGLKRITNCMRKHGIRANIRKKKRNRIQRHEEYINDNLLQGQFDRETKNEVWVTDTTEVAYGEHTLHKVRVHVILDLYGRYALSYNISDTETSSAVIETFNRAFTVEPDAQPMIHTDRGSAYCSSMFNDYLASKNCIHSMSHPGHPWENSPIERWWNDFKLIWINKHPRPKTLAELEQLVKGAIEYFNTKRAYTSKNGLTAEQFRNQAA